MAENNTVHELEALFSKAVEIHQKGDITEACRLYSKILEEVPDSPLVHYNFGLALFEKGNYDTSCHHYQKALEQAPKNVDILYNLALSFSRCGMLNDAIMTYEDVLKFQPDDVDSLYNLGCIYKDNDDIEKASGYYMKVLSIAPEHQAALNNIAYIHHKNGNYSEAKKYYTLLVQLNPHHAAANHMLSSLDGKTPRSADPRYVAEIFDSYSCRYESSLVDNLEYTVPRKMRSYFDQNYSIDRKSLQCLDLGCGTGLGGQAFDDLCKTLDGVDISAKMIELARQKKLYSTLTCNEIDGFLSQCENSYDLILATDVFTYIGELGNIFTQIFRLLGQSKYCCFSVEYSATEDYCLLTSGRFAHSQNYIVSLSKKIGFSDIKYIPAQLRKEKGKWVEGLLFVLVK